MSKKRYGVLVTCPPKPPHTSWMTDGDQDGDRWTGSWAEAEKQAMSMKRVHPNCTVEVLPIIPEK